RPLPNSTIFPYTTLFRSLAEEALHVAVDQELDEAPVPVVRDRRLRGTWRDLGDPLPERDDAPPVVDVVGCGSGVADLVPTGIERSEEHTSELQSPCNLVC